VLGNLDGLLQDYGLFLLFVLVAVECCGIPLPGESALITMGVLASQHRFNIVAVIAVAASAAIIGDGTGYWIARKGGRKLIAKIPIARDVLPRFLPRGERFFERHGPKTVVIARFMAGLRITVAWLAGISHMPWKRFFFYNATGGVLWATTVGLASFWAGAKAVDAVVHYGLYAVIALVVLGIAAFVVHRILHKRSEHADEASAEKAALDAPAAE